MAKTNGNYLRITLRRAVRPPCRSPAQRLRLISTTDGSHDPLLARAAEYVADGNHDATPDEVLREADLDESWREQVECFCAMTRYTMFKNDEGTDADGLTVNTIEWARSKPARSSPARCSRRSPRPSSTPT
jgi:Tfp pilus assembly protein FimV